MLEQDHKSVFNVGFELFGEQYRTFQALQQDGAVGAVDGGGGDRHQRDPCRHQQHTGDTLFLAAHVLYHDIKELSKTLNCLPRRVKHYLVQRWLGRLHSR